MWNYIACGITPGLELNCVRNYIASRITSRPELHRVWNYIASRITLRPELHCVRNCILSGITSHPELHCVQKYIVCGITHTHNVQSQHIASASPSDDVRVDRAAVVAGAVGHWFLWGFRYIVLDIGLGSIVVGGGNPTPPPIFSSIWGWLSSFCDPPPSPPLCNLESSFPWPPP